MQQVLEQLRASSRAIRAAAVLGHHGEILGMASEDGLADIVAPLITALSSMAARGVDELLGGDLLTVTVEGTQGRLFTWELPENRVLVVVATQHDNLGMLRHDINRARAAL